MTSTTARTALQTIRPRRSAIAFALQSSAFPFPTLTRRTSFIPLPCRPFSIHAAPTRRSNQLGRPGSGRVLAMAAVDLKFIRSNAESVRQNIVDRAVNADVDLVIQLYNDLIDLSTRTDQVRAARNANAARMKGAGKMAPDERTACIAEGKALKSELADLEQKLNDLEIRLSTEAARIPNMTHPDVPKGDESQAKLLTSSGAKPNFQPPAVCRSHVDLLQLNDWADFENAARISGNKFYCLRNEAALLEIALVQWSMSVARQHGFTVMTTPDVAREEVVAGCGFQPRGESSQVYRLEDSDLCLVGTAEIVLGGYYAGQIIDRSQLPIRLASFSHCFRREVGAAGMTTKGLYRVHQFSKVELFVLAHPDESDQIHQELRELEESMYESLGLHFKTLDMPTADLGNPAWRKFDIEAWMPAREDYGEISSASNCTDYQARRLAIRYRETQGDNRYVHTLNATACAVPRMIIAILETHQQPDGSVTIPKVLRPFMGGLGVIGGPNAPHLVGQKSGSHTGAVSAS